MARKIEKENPTEELKAEKSIDESIKKYYENNTIKSAADKICKEESAFIKKYFSDNKLENYETDLYSAKISSSTSMEYDEELLLNEIKKLPKEYQQRLVVTTESVDMEQMEKLIASGEIKAETLKAALVEKSTQRLYVKPKKK